MADRAASAPDGVAALDLAARGLIRPDFILADYNLPNGMNGLEAIAKLRGNLGRDIPAIVLTGDISTGALRAIADDKIEQLNKPVNLIELTDAIKRLLHAPPPVLNPDRHSEQPSGVASQISRGIELKSAIIKTHIFQARRGYKAVGKPVQFAGIRYCFDSRL